jgi:hypothetical protein
VQPSQASTGWLVGGGTDAESATTLAEYQKQVAAAVATYEENIWRELEPEVGLQLTQTESEVKKLGSVLQVLRDEIESEKRAQVCVVCVCVCGGGGGVMVAAGRACVNTFVRLCSFAPL